MADKVQAAKKKPNIDDHPAHMQFFKWAQMKYLSKDALDILQSYCYGSNDEVCQFMFKLMRYYHKQKAKDDEYIEQQKQAGIEGIKPTASSSNKRKVVEDAVDATETLHESRNSVDEEIEFLLDQRRELERALEEETDDVEDEENVDEKETAVVEGKETHGVSTANIPHDSTLNLYNSPIPFDPLQSPRLQSIKQEPTDDARYTVIRAPPTAIDPTRSETAEAPASYEVKPEPSLSHCDYTDSASSTVGIVDEPLTTPAARKARKSVRFSSEASSMSPHRQLLSARTSLKSSASSGSQVQKVSNRAAHHSAISPTRKRPAAPVAVQKQPVEAQEQTSAPVSQQLTVQQRHLRKEQHVPIVPAVKDEPTPPPRIAEDPIKVAILSCNLLKLNQQIDYIDKIRGLAREQELASEIFYITADPLGDPSPNFKLSTFHEMRKYAAKLVEETDCDLAKFPSLSIASLRRTLREVKTEIEGIWKRVCVAMKNHLVDADFGEQQQKQPAPVQSTRQPQPSKKNTSKRPHSATVVAQKQITPPTAKRRREPLLDTPQASKDASAAASGLVPVPRLEKDIPAAPVEPWLGLCAFCGDAHDPIKCPVYVTHEEREARRAELKLCWYCLLIFDHRNHKKSCLGIDKKCTNCNRHTGHAALCRRLCRKTVRTEARSSKNRAIQPAETFEDNGAQFSPLAPIHEEEVTTEPSPQYTS